MLTNIPTDFKDLVRKAMPQSKRGDTWLDWNFTATSPIRELNARYNDLVNTLTFINSYSIQTMAFEPLLNDLFDPILRGISVTSYNDPTIFKNFSIQWPDYLAYGNYEAVIHAAISRYLYLGLNYSVDVYTYGGTAPEFVAYFDKLVSNLGVGESLTDEEIWAVVYLWNQLYGSGYLSDFVKLNLMSKSNFTNSKVDFLTPTGGLVETLNGGVADFDRWGLASDGLSYYKVGSNPAAYISDVNNYCSLLYISKDRGETGKWEAGTHNGTAYDGISVNNTATEITVERGKSTDTLTAPNIGRLGTYIHYTDAGLQGIMWKGKIIGTPAAIDAAAALSTQQKYLSAFNLNGTVGLQSKNKIGSFAEIASPLNAGARVFISDVFTEFNRRMGR